MMAELVTDDRVRIHFRIRSGGDSAVFYLHCMGGNAGLWRCLWDQLALSENTHVALDFRGHGQSARDPCLMTNERLSRDVLSVADALGIKRFAVVGHSMGAKVGLYLAGMEPERVDRLVVLGCPGPGLVPIAREDVAEFLDTYDTPAVSEAFFRPWIHVWPSPEVDAWIRSFVSVPKWAMRAAAEMSIWTDISSSLAGLCLPSLVVTGNDDPVYGPTYQRKAVLPFLPNAREAVIGHCGHGMFLERPAEIAGYLREFLS